jgi:hypothetical protein
MSSEKHFSLPERRNIFRHPASRGLRVGAGVWYAKAVVCVFSNRIAPCFRISRMIAASVVPIRPL